VKQEEEEEDWRTKREKKQKIEQANTMTLALSRLSSHWCLLPVEIKLE
jgi:hypothetical protein